MPFLGAPWIGDAKLAYDCMDDAGVRPEQRVRAAKQAGGSTARRATSFSHRAPGCATCVDRALKEASRWFNGWDAVHFPWPTQGLPASGPLILAYFERSTAGSIAPRSKTLRTCPDVSIRLIGPNATVFARSPDERSRQFRAKLAERREQRPATSAIHSQRPDSRGRSGEAVRVWHSRPILPPIGPSWSALTT